MDPSRTEDAETPESVFYIFPTLSFTLRLSSSSRAGGGRGPGTHPGVSFPHTVRKAAFPVHRAVPPDAVSLMVFNVPPAAPHPLPPALPPRFFASAFPPGCPFFPPADLVPISMMLFSYFLRDQFYRMYILTRVSKLFSQRGKPQDIFVVPQKA